MPVDMRIRIVGLPSGRRTAFQGAGRVIFRVVFWEILQGGCLRMVSKCGINSAANSVETDLSQLELNCLGIQVC